MTHLSPPHYIVNHNLWTSETFISAINFLSFVPWEKKKKKALDNVGNHCTKTVQKPEKKNQLWQHDKTENRFI